MKIIIIIITIILLGIGSLYFARNILVESAIEDGSNYALGVDTDLGSARLEFSGGTLELNNFEVSNPDGYETDNFFVMNSLVLDVNEGSLLDDEVIVDSFVIDGIELNFEQVGTKSNIQEVIKHIKQLDVKSSENGSQRFKINTISIRNISVSTIYNVLGNKGEKKFEVDDFTLKKIGAKNGVTIGELAALIVKKITTKVIAANHNLPTEKYLKELGDKVGGAVKEIADDAAEKIDELGKSIFGK